MRCPAAARGTRPGRSVSNIASTLGGKQKGEQMVWFKKKGKGKGLVSGLFDVFFAFEVHLFWHMHLSFSELVSCADSLFSQVVFFLCLFVS